jgi:hypothetical protein
VGEKRVKNAARRVTLLTVPQAQAAAAAKKKTAAAAVHADLAKPAQTGCFMQTAL